MCRSYLITQFARQRVVQRDESLVKLFRIDLEQMNEIFQELAVSARALSLCLHCH